MGIEKLKSSLLSEAQAEADKIIQSAESQAGATLETERTKGKAMRVQAQQQVESMLDEQRNERMAWARLEAKRVLSEAREDAIKGVIEDFFGALEGMRKTPEYKAFLKRGVESASAELGGNVTIHICKGDKDLLPKMKGMSVVEDLDTLGGAIVESSSGKVQVNLTIETMFEARRDELRKKIHEKLFGGK